MLLNPIGSKVIFRIRRFVGNLEHMITRWRRALWSRDLVSSNRLKSEYFYAELEKECRDLTNTRLSRLTLSEKVSHEREEWFFELAKATQIVPKKDLTCYTHGFILYDVVTQYLRAGNRSNVTILEIGTARGFSALAMARSMADQGASGKILTVDLLPHRTNLLWNTHQDVTRGARSREILLEPWHDLLDSYVIFVEANSRSFIESVSISRINVAFLDGSHTYRDIHAEVSQVAPRQVEGDLIVFDDVSQTKYPELALGIETAAKIFGYQLTYLEINENRGVGIAVKA